MFVPSNGVRVYGWRSLLLSILLPVGKRICSKMRIRSGTQPSGRESHACQKHQLLRWHVDVGHVFLAEGQNRTLNFRDQAGDEFGALLVGGAAGQGVQEGAGFDELA